ncbi:MAG TPA: FHA domain-containing protein, partial [Intrasporangiaceae bacterium]|nr:FHA domain-containing protein [Intrasporangiaceae bacterium]
MSELTVTILRLGLLAALWFFVFSIVTVLRSDLYGTRIVTRREARRDARAA